MYEKLSIEKYFIWKNLINKAAYDHDFDVYNL